MGDYRGFCSVEIGDYRGSVQGSLSHYGGGKLRLMGDYREALVTLSQKRKICEVTTGGRL